MDAFALLQRPEPHLCAVAIALEEAGLPYRARARRISPTAEQTKTRTIWQSTQGRVPALALEKYDPAETCLA